MAEESEKEMKWLILKTQDDEGCGYTIRCGVDYDVIEADTLADAEEAAVWPDGREEYSSLCCPEFGLAKITILPFDDVHEVDVASYKKLIAEQKRRDSEAAEESKERAELERLRAKYGG